MAKNGRRSASAQLVDRDDAGVLELPADLRLLDESPDHVHFVAVLLAQDFQRHVAVKVGISALEDAPMPPRAISPSIR